MNHAGSGVLHPLAQRLVGELAASKRRLALAESCTGGWAAKLITDVAGSSQVFDRGFVTYSDSAKCEMLGVSAGLIDLHGAVSEPVVRAMVQGALAATAVDLAGAVSGIAGPGGGSEAKPVGTVWFAWGERRGVVQSRCCRFDGDRDAVRSRAVETLLQGLLDLQSGAASR